MIGELIAIGLASGAATAVGVSVGREKKRRAVWRDVAVELGADVRPKASALAGAQGAFDVEVGVARLFVDCYREDFGSTRSRFTRVSAMYPQRAAPKFRVHRHGLFSSMVRTIASVGVSLGDPEFDRRFVVRADDEAAVRKVWSKAARDALLGSVPTADARCDGLWLRVRVPGWCRDREQLLSLIGLAGELASADLYGREALRAIPGGIYHETEGEWMQRTAPKVELHLPQRVLVGPITLDGKLRTVAYVAEAPRELEQRTIRVEAGLAAPTEALAALPRRIQADIVRVGDGRLLVGKDLRFIWDDIEIDPSRLRTCAEMLSALVVGLEEGVYR